MTLNAFKKTDFFCSYVDVQCTYKEDREEEEEEEEEEESAVDVTTSNTTSSNTKSSNNSKSSVLEGWEITAFDTSLVKCNSCGFITYVNRELWVIFRRLYLCYVVVTFPIE